ncbi:SNF-related serine/threonine-protein kinase-like [Argiope bruennichi]|uniref:SNF-related serine/threonine-protein kinase n=1 Tax=Argiope bruennichi TaxID=94029 RepID=A0A8T0FSI4_ARGBR|nr:SNF-related serine/threonine-protein kinase-like [Argiope bruennichi]KAF8794124.1 SNF-related serine/threonine-protein kinase like protein [Argiope bruennichi]
MMSRSRNNAHYDGKIAGLYDLGDTLGRGHFAVVKLAKHVFTGEQVAVKVIDKTRLDDVSRAHLFQEVRCMKLVQHPNVVRLYDVIDTQTKLYLILELGDGGDMYDYILKHENGVDEETAKKYFRQIVHAISYCHKLHVVHRDLKPENVVFFEKLGMVKLTDFGFSNKFCPGQKLETSCGSLAYSAPEILLGDSYDAPKVDVWSLGVILYMLVCGRAPFQEANDSETLTMIMDCKYTIPQHLSPECVRLIGAMLIRDPEKRATLEQIADDEWLNSGDAIQPADHLPLISREHLSEEDHTHIVQKMVNGNIASKEEIIEALDKNEYNHITATYFLLAERKLRAQRQERAQMINSRISRTDLSPVALTPSVSSAVPSPAQEKPNASVEGLLSPCLPSKPMQANDFNPHFGLMDVSSRFSMEATGPNIPFQRKCSIVREEEDVCSTASGASSPAKSPSVESKSLKEQLSKLEEDKSESSVKISSPSKPAFSLPVPNRSNFLPPFEIKTSKLSLNLDSSSSHKGNRRLHSVQSSPQLPLNEINEEKDISEKTTPSHIGAARKKYVGKLQSRNTAISQLMMKKMEQQRSDKIGESPDSSIKMESSGKDEDIKCEVGCNESLSNQDSKLISLTISHNEPARHKELEGSKSWKDSTTDCQNQQVKKASFAHSVFSTESTDSLDFLSDNQPRLTSSMSCGDLSADTSRCVPQERPAIVRSDSISLTEIPQLAAEEVKEERRHKPFVDSTFNRYTSSIGNSVSLNSGLSSLQRHKLNLKGDLHRSQPDKISDKNGRVSTLGRFVHSGSRSANRQRLDINQNGWKKNERKKELSAGRGNQQAVVDMKLASKCCMLC